MKILSDRQYRGLLILLPLALTLLAIAIAIELFRPIDEQYAEAVKAEVEENSLSEQNLQEFDPNTFSYEQLREAGVPKSVAVGVVRWREYGKVYRVKEDMALVSGMTDSLYFVLEPYIVIADSLVAKPAQTQQRTYPDAASKRRTARVVEKKDFEQKEVAPTYPEEKFLIDTASAAYLVRWGLSPRQADVVVRYRDARGGIGSEQELRDCYVISTEVADRMMPFVEFSAEAAVAYEDVLVELNDADSARLVALRGIGAKSAAEIVKYRDLLGGYHSVEQILELKCVTEQNYEQILQQIYCDSCKIKKIDINFATPKAMARHPYVSAGVLRKVIKQRQLKGGWSRIEEMVEDEILSEDEAKRLAPYLWFRLDATE